jgi:class 3 adenylate cyclase
MPEFHYRHTWHVHAAPEAIWPFVANSHRLNYEWGNAPLVSRVPRGQRLPNGYHHVQASIVDFVEEPFQWVKPRYHHGFRRFGRGQFFDGWRAVTTLEPAPQGGTHVTYEMWVTPGNALGYALAPLTMRYVFWLGAGRSIPRFDRVASAPGASMLMLPPRSVTFAPAGRARLDALRPMLLARASDLALAGRLLTFLETADDLQITRFRPYVLAESWQAPRRAVLEVCLLATRLGLLEFSWELLCPLCRGTQDQSPALSDLPTRVHCDTCNIDVSANFENSVELLFNPAPAVRPTLLQRFCVGSPQLTPHVVVQQLLRPGETRALPEAPLEPGHYRVRALELSGNQPVVVQAEGATTWRLNVTPTGWPPEAQTLAPRSTLHWHNATRVEQLVILERTAWSDQAVTAAEVTAMQAFRDLFAREALRPGEHITVGNVTIAFTDLRGSTQLYRQAGDAAAFGRVLSHFDILKEAIAAEGGAIVKTIGDAVMAVFTRPAPALRAILAAQRQLADSAPPLHLKAGIHVGPCIAVALNDRLDYFGTTVNLTARLESLCRAANTALIISAETYADPEVQAWFATQPTLRAEALTAEVKGFEGEALQVWKVTG